MREFFHEEAVFEGAGFAFVCIYNNILFASCSVTDDSPLQAGWEACASHAAEPTVFECLNHWRDIFAREQTAKRAEAVRLLRIRIDGERCRALLDHSRIRNLSTLELAEQFV